MVKKQCKNKWKTAKDGIKSVRADLADILKGKVERYYFVNSQRKPCFFFIVAVSCSAIYVDFSLVVCCLSCLKSLFRIRKVWLHSQA